MLTYILVGIVCVAVGVVIGQIMKSETTIQQWSNWQDVPPKVKHDFRNHLRDMRESTERLFKSFEEELEDD